MAVNVMKKKMRKKRKHRQVIIPMRKKCLAGCGKTVKNHHFFCDDCWAQKAKAARKGRKGIWKWKKRNLLKWNLNEKYINLKRSDIYKYRSIKNENENEQ